MEYSLDAFVNRIREVMYDNFPYESDEVNYRKHVVGDRGKVKNPKPYHIRDIAFMNLPVTHNLDTRTFDIGSEYAELEYPYYHILQDSEVIHIKGRGTKTSKGSQDKISDKSARDYGIVKWNGKTFSREYDKNVRGVRSKQGKARKVYVDNNGVVYRINANANTYVNVHYKYIDRILDNTIQWIAHEFGMTMRRKEDSGLKEDYDISNEMAYNDNVSNILDILDSFREEE